MTHLTPEQAEERECMADDRAKARKEDALIESMEPKVGDVRLDEFIHPDSIDTTVWEVRQLTHSFGKYSKPGDTHWKRMDPYLEPFTDKAEAVRFMDSLRAKSGIVKRFLRGGFRGSLGGQLLHDDEHKAVCDHIKYLEAQLEAK